MEVSKGLRFATHARMRSRASARGQCGFTKCESKSWGCGGCFFRVWAVQAKSRFLAALGMTSSF